jgi:cobaltochelatase CobN
VLDATNNFWGWTAVAREIVRDDQWQEMVDVYVRDKHRLGLRDWFERENPHALAQTIERMLEAARQGYWQADAATVAELKQRWKDLAARFDVKTDNARFNRFVGYGLGKILPALASRPQTAADLATPPSPPVVRGMKLEKQSPPRTPPAAPLLAGALLLILASVGGGMASAARNKTFHRPNR